MATVKTIIQWWYLYASYAGITTVFIIMLGFIGWKREEKVKKIIFTVFVVVFLLAGLNIVFGLKQFFSWSNINVFDVDFWLSFIVILFYGKFLQLIKKVFGKISFRKLPDILWSFVKIVPGFLKQIFPVLKKMWKKQLRKGGKYEQ